MSSHKRKMSPERRNDQTIKIDLDKPYTIVKVSKKFAKLRNQVRILICGPTMCGKSTMVLDMLRYKQYIFINPHFVRVIYCTDNPHNKQEYIEELEKVCKEVEVHKGMIDLEKENLTDRSSGSKLIIFDDLMSNFFNDFTMSKLMTQWSHHSDINVIVTSQNYFSKKKDGTTIMKQFSQVIAFLAQSDKLALQIMSSHWFPGQPSLLNNIGDWVHDNLTDDHSKYVVYDNNTFSQVPRNMVLRTRIFPKDEDSEPEPIFFALPKTK